MSFRIIIFTLLAGSFVLVLHQYKRIKLLENENVTLLEMNKNIKNTNYIEYTKIYNNAKKAVIDSIIFDKDDNDMLICKMSKLDVFNFHKTGKVNSKYQSRYKLFDMYNSNDFDVEYTPPSKTRIEYSIDHYFINPPTENLIFIPKDTGFYYWTGNLIVRNLRTGRVQRWPFMDSLLVY